MTSDICTHSETIVIIKNISITSKVSCVPLSFFSAILSLETFKLFSITIALLNYSRVLNKANNIRDILFFLVLLFSNLEIHSCSCMYHSSFVFLLSNTVALPLSVVLFPWFQLPTINGDPKN